MANEEEHYLGIQESNFVGYEMMLRQNEIISVNGYSAIKTITGYNFNY